MSHTSALGSMRPQRGLVDDLHQPVAARPVGAERALEGVEHGRVSEDPSANFFRFYRLTARSRKQRLKRQLLRQEVETLVFERFDSAAPLPTLLLLYQEETLMEQVGLAMAIRS